MIYGVYTCFMEVYDKICTINSCIPLCHVLIILGLGIMGMNGVSASLGQSEGMGPYSAERRGSRGVKRELRGNAGS